MEGGIDGDMRFRLGDRSIDGDGKACMAVAHLYMSTCSATSLAIAGVAVLPPGLSE